MRRLLKGLFLVLTLAYPFIIYWGQQHISPLTLSFFVFGMIAVRAYAIGLATTTGRYWFAGGALLVLLTFVLDKYEPLYWYPALVNLGLLVVFTHSLYTPPPIIERMARLYDPNLPSYAIDYTRKVTVVWCIFFILNGSLAAATAVYADEELWTLYNGIVAYGLISALFIAEWLYRQHYRKQHARNSNP
ncbi:MAG: hypothetical protein ACRCV6_00155 [Formosimonas sp.]